MNTTPPWLETVLATVRNDSWVRKVADTADAHGARLYLVGGAVRDLIRLGTLPTDLDFAVTGAPAEGIARAAADRLGGYYVLLDADFGIHRVVLKLEDGQSITLDIADALRDDIECDLARRDLSVNAMAIEVTARDVPGSSHFLDPFQGALDLENKTIRMVSEANLLADPLRLLRVIRIGAQVGAERFEARTLQAVKTHRDKLLAAAGERIQYEFLRLLSFPRCFPYLEHLADTGLLEVILPELTPTHQVPPNNHHHLWLFEHTLELVYQAERLLQELPTPAQSAVLSLMTPSATRFGLLKLACLLHDVGKPETMAVREDGRPTFYGHDKLSEEMSDAIGKRLKMSREATEYVKKLVRWHLYPCQFGPQSTRKAVLRFFRRMGEETPDVILLALADRFSTLGPDITLEMLNTSYENHLWLLIQYYAEEETLKLPRLLNGQDIMKLLGISPGPKVGEILEALQEAQQLGEVTDSEAARGWVVETFRGTLGV